MAKRHGPDGRTAQRHLSVLPDAGRASGSDIRNPYNKEVRWEILLLEPVNDWFLALCKDEAQIAAMMGVSQARVSQIEHGKVTEVDAIRGYVEALGGTVDVVARVGDWTVRVA
jgi:transcriptional regulator with XRE-family HTH domain